MGDLEFDLEWESGFDPDDAEAVFESMLEEADDRLVAEMTDLALKVERGARMRSPVDTGNLHASWDSEVRTSRGEITGEVGTNTHYAPHVEFGTRHMSAQPMLRPALDAEIRNFRRQVIQTVYEVAESEGNA